MVIFKGIPIFTYVFKGVLHVQCLSYHSNTVRLCLQSCQAGLPQRVDCLVPVLFKYTATRYCIGPITSPAVEAIPLSALLKDTTNELAYLFFTLFL